jgi:light-regulated signal transduction histidine kinase (bacteriophytochrome)
VDLQSLAETVAKGVMREGEPLKLQVSLPVGTAVSADPRILGMALHNHFENASKYHLPDESPVVELGQKIRYGERIFFVRDEGIGFDMAFVHKLFIPFERLHRDSEYKREGRSRKRHTKDRETWRAGLG